MKIQKENWLLILAFAVPAAMILVVALVIYIPNLSARPKYDFIYALGPYYISYQTDNSGHIYQLPNDGSGLPEAPKNPPTPAPQLYYYSVSTSQSLPLTFAAAQKYTLNRNQESPDGYFISSGSYNDGLFSLFGGPNNDYNSEYLRGHGLNRKLNLPLEPSYASSFEMLGWVTGQ